MRTRCHLPLPCSAESELGLRRDRARVSLPARGFAPATGDGARALSRHRFAQLSVAEWPRSVARRF